MFTLATAQSALSVTGAKCTDFMHIMYITVHINLYFCVKCMHSFLHASVDFYFIQNAENTLDTVQFFPLKCTDNNNYYYYSKGFN